MKILLVRCGQTADDEGRVLGTAAMQRPLSPEERRAVRATAAGLASTMGAISAVLSSPLMAAIETAAIVAKAFDLRFHELAQLDPAARRVELQNWLEKQPQNASLALVGHERSLSRLACGLLSGQGRFLSIKPAGGCLLNVDFSNKAVQCRLEWVMTARQLRRHGR